MKRPTLLYVPLLILFIVAAAAYVGHAGRVFVSLGRIFDHSSSVRFPFELKKGIIANVYSEGGAAGIKTGDRLLGVNGRMLSDEDVHLMDEIGKLRIGEKTAYTVERKDDNGESVQYEFYVENLPLQLSFTDSLYEAAIPFLFLLCLPALSFLLGFYVAFFRPRDPMAWVLLLLLLGIGSIALEDNREGSFVKTFQEIALNLVGIWMILFGVYFPERLASDRRFPFVKWVLIAPLALLGGLNVIEQLGRFFSLSAVWQPIDALTAHYDNVFTILTMVAIGVFFACMATKSGTLENRDSRRRLKILYVGTSVAMLPSLFLIIYRIATGKQGGFFELVPGWLAIYALVSMLLFPLTMAYVIVVQRAMDVSVVIRQGLKYALAKNGVVAIQIGLFLLIILGALSFVSDPTANRSQKLIFIGIAIALFFLIRILAGKIMTWMDRKFFRESYDAEQILTDLSEDVRTMIETRPLLETVAARISESLHVPQVALLLRTGSDFLPAYALGFDTPPAVSLSDDSRAIGKLRSNRHIVLYDDMTEVTSMPTVSLSEREQLTELNTQILLPLAVKNELSGIISLSPKLSEEPYTASDLRLLRSVASQTGLALENSRLAEAIARDAAQKERLNRELEIAREVQERLFPQELPVIEGLDYYGACRPALGVGGDYYDFLELPDDRLGIAIGDISGKGIGAALMMASLQATLRGQTIHYKDDLAGLMKQINGLLYETSTTNRYATFFYAQYHTKIRKLAYVNAGHNPPFLLRANGDVELLEDGGAVVGMLPSMLVNYTHGEIELQVGDLLVGYTDGISESMNPEEEEWSEESMLEFLKSVSQKPAHEILTDVVAAADKFANGAKQHDDMTMIVVKVL